MNMGTSKQESGSYSIREADLVTDAASIAELWASNLTGYDLETAAAKLSSAYRDNPASGASVQLLSVQGESMAVGAQGLHSRTFWLGDRSLRGVGLGDFVVNVAHRSLWPALMLMRHCIQLGSERFELTYGFPNKKATAVCRRSGLKQFGEMDRYARLLSSRAYLARRLPDWLAAFAAPVVDSAMRMRDVFNRLAEPARLTCNPIDWHDPAIDTLWSRRDDTLWFSERSNRMLHWRFDPKGCVGWQICVAIDDQGIAQGYIVWRSLQGMAEVGDFFSSSPAKWTAPLLRSFAEMASARGMHSVSVEFFGTSQVVQQILLAGLRRRSERHPLYICGVLPEGHRTPASWYLTIFDDDAD